MARIEEYVPITGRAAIDDLRRIGEKLAGKVVQNINSTAVGGGIAIPHVRNPIVLHIDQPVITMCFLKSPIDFNALDRKPVSILFIVLSPSIKMHLALLARLAFCLRDPKLQDYLHRKASREEVMADFFVLEAKLDVYKNGNGKRLTKP